MSLLKAGLAVCGTVWLVSGTAMADTFGTGPNQFTMDFVPISGDASSANGTAIGSGKQFFDPDEDYRICVYEITNDQWNKFKAELGVPVTGNPLGAYDQEPRYTGLNVPTNRVSWYEAAQFVNWLNVSKGYHPAYNFTGTQGNGNYAFETWNIAEASSGTNLFRHKDAFYFLPTEEEWVKASYWNGYSLQTWATTDDMQPIAGLDSNSDNEVGQPWEVGTGNEELNGTYDMMGNVGEWMESPYTDMSYNPGSIRAVRGGSYGSHYGTLASSFRAYHDPGVEDFYVGFRVASEVPEPATLLLVVFGGMAMLWKVRERTPQLSSYLTFLAITLFVGLGYPGLAHGLVIDSFSEEQMLESTDDQIVEQTVTGSMLGGSREVALFPGPSSSVAIGNGKVTFTQYEVGQARCDLRYGALTPFDNFDLTLGGSADAFQITVTSLTLPGIIVYTVVNDAAANDMERHYIDVTSPGVHRLLIGQHPPYTDAYSFNFWYQAYANSDPGYVVIEDLLIVPEPTTVSILGMSLVALCLRRRNSRRLNRGD